MPQSRVSIRYAKALLGLAKEQSSVDAVFEDMQFLAEAIRSSRDLDLFLESPIIKGDKKAKVFSSLFKEKIGSLSYDFLSLVLKKHREKDIQHIVEAYIEQYNLLNSITKVQLTTAQELSQEAEAKIISQLKDQAQLKNIELEKAIDPRILGGFVVEYDGKILDASVKNNLNQIKKRFTA